MTEIEETYKLISKKFKNGLKDYNLTLDNFKKQWVYCGGNDKSGENYFKLFYKNKTIPEIPFKTHCICGNKIKKKYYYTNNKGEYLVIGSICSKKFHNKKKTCDKCCEFHKNRIVNRCNFCRKHFCDECGKKKGNVCYPMCWECYKRKKNEKIKKTKEAARVKAKAERMKLEEKFRKNKEEEEQIKMIKEKRMKGVWAVCGVDPIPQSDDEGYWPDQLDRFWWWK